MHRLALVLLAACSAAPAPRDPPPSAPPGHHGQLAISPASLDLPETDVGTTTNRAFTIANVGTTATDTLGLSVLAGSDLRIAIDDCFARRLAPGATCTVLVRFAPTVAGVQHATLAVGDATAPISARARLAVADL